MDFAIMGFPWKLLASGTVFPTWELTVAAVFCNALLHQNEKHAFAQSLGL